MTEKRCCTKWLIDTGYIGGVAYREHEGTGRHDWLDDGQFCCLNWPADHKHQRCWCNAGRWVERLSAVSSDTITNEQIQAMQKVADSIADLAEDARRIGELTAGELTSSTE